MEVHVDGVDVCYGATSHPSGIAALGASLISSSGQQRFAYDSSGSARGQPMADLFPRADIDTYFHPVSNGFRGFVALRGASTVEFRVRTWDLSGNVVGDLALGVATLAPLPDGGSIVVASPSSGRQLVWLDAEGSVTRTVPLDKDADRAIVNWSTGHVFAFIGGTSVRPTEGRWYDSAGAPLTPWFDLRLQKGSGFYQRLLSGGVVALGNEGGAWVAAVLDGVAGAQDVPAWLAARPGTRLATVRNGRGFAVVSAAGLGAVEVVTPAGESCGTVDLPAPGADLGNAATYPSPRVDVGWDGTVFQSILVQVPGSPSAQRCLFRWWPALLK